jgi:putative copper resistance protein D
VFLAIDALVIALRAIAFVALFQAAGGAIFLTVYERSLALPSADTVRNVARAAALVALCATVLSYVLTPARMAGDFGSTFDPSLESLLLRSNSGTAHIVRVVGLAVLLLALDRASVWQLRAATVGAALALGSFALMGHTVIHAQRWALAPLLLAHVGVAAFWVGGLTGLYVGVRDTGVRAAALVARFSTHAVRLVPAILVAGVLMAVLFVRSFAELATPYGAMVVGKTAAFAALVALAARNKWRFGPRLAAGEEGAAAGLRRTIVTEWLIIAVVLVATAAMTSLFAPEHLEGGFAPEHEPEPTH